MKIDRLNPKNKLKIKQMDDIKKFFNSYWRKDHSNIKEEHPFLNQLPINTKKKLLL